MFKKTYILVTLLYSLSFSSTLTLSEAYSLALNNDPKTKSVEYRSLSQNDVVVQARSKLMPQFNINFTGGKQSYTIGNEGTPYYQNRSNAPYTSWMFMLTQPLLHLDDLANLSVEYIRTRGMQADYQKQKQTLGLDVAKAYFGYIKAQTDENLAKAEKEHYESVYLRASGLLKGRIINKMDAMQAEIDFKQAQIKYISKQKQVAVAAYGLEKLIGEPVTYKILLDPQTINSSMLNLDKEYWQKRLSKNLDVYSAQTNLDMAGRTAHARYLENAPKVDLQLSYNPLNTPNPSVTRNAENAFVVMNMPIFTGGYNYGRVGEARMLAKSAGENLESVTRDTKLQFENIWASREFNLQSVELLRQSVLVAKLYLSTAERQIKTGLKSSVDVFAAKRQLFQKENDLVDSSYNLVNNELELLSVVGELNEDSIKDLEKNLNFKVQSK